jgi:hypothetical protein
VVPVDRTENRKMVKKKGVKKRKKKNGEGEQTGNPGPRMAP